MQEQQKPVVQTVWQPPFDPSKLTPRQPKDDQGKALRKLLLKKNDMPTWNVAAVSHRKRGEQRMRVIRSTKSYLIVVPSPGSVEHILNPPAPLWHSLAQYRQDHDLLQAADIRGLRVLGTWDSGGWVWTFDQPRRR